MRSARCGLLAALASLLSIAPAAAAVSPVDASTTHVVLVGVEDYGVRGATLTGPSRDICALYRTYVDVLRIPAANVRVFFASGDGFGPQSACSQIRSRSATRAALIAGLQEIAPTFSNASLVIVNFSGHGEASGREQFLLLADDGNKATSRISLAEVVTNMRFDRPHRAKLALFIDACRDTVTTAGPSQRADQSVLPAADVASSFLKSDVAVFLATAPASKSYIRPHYANDQPVHPIGYFTWTLIKGLLGSAGDADGRLSANDLAEYLRKEVPALLSFEFVKERLTQVPEAGFSTTAAREMLMPARSRKGDSSFLFFAEVRLIPTDGKGVRYGGTYSFDLMTPQMGRPPSELMAISPTEMAFPGPFRTPLPRNIDLPATIEKWEYSARVTFLVGSSRKEFVVCDRGPNVSLPGATPEVSTRVTDGNFEIDALQAFRLWGRALGDMEPDSNDRAPTHSRRAAPGCLPGG